MLNIFRILTAVTALGIVAGCGRSDNSNSTGGTSSQTTADQTSTATATSRETNASNRVYSTDTTTTNTLKDADNTGRNVRDRSDATLTPGDQGNSESDREITRQIRRALSSNDQFSTMAKNIKIITVNGQVTLRGPVNSEQEKQAILSAAQSAASGSTVDNQLEVKAANQ